MTSTTGCAPGCSISTACEPCRSLADLLDEVDATWPGLERSRVIHELVRRVITRFVEDVIAESERRLVALAPVDADAVRGAGRTGRGLFGRHGGRGPPGDQAFLFANMYRHPR